MKSAAEREAPGASLASGPRPNVFYPQARCTLSVIFEEYEAPDADDFTRGVPRTFDVIPKAMTIHSNSYKEADTWQLTFNANDLPVSPELIRTGAAQLYLFAARGIGDRPKALRGDGGDEPVEAGFLGVVPSMVGLFDEVETAFGEDGRWVTITGQDYTSLFIAKQWKPKRRLPAGQRLDRIVALLKDEVESARAMRLVIDPPELAGKMPIVGAEAGRTNKKGESVPDTNTYWDAIYKLCIRHGFIVFVRNLELVITTPQAFMGARPSPRLMTWGRNLLTLKMKRRMAKETVPVIECRSYDESTRTVVRGRYPETGKGAKKAVTGLGTRKEETRLYTIWGIRSAKRLAEIAETTYNLVARAEQSIVLTTRDLVDSEGKDLLGVRTGDALAIAFDERFGAGMMESLSWEQRVEALVALGYDRAVAVEVALGFEDVNLFRRPFRVKSSTLEWTSEGGLEVQVELQNFVNIRGQAP